MRECAYPGLDGAPLRLLSDDEYAALSITRGCLTADERRQIEKHVVDSYSFLILIPWTRDLAGVPSIAHGHHEKLDGSGYPMGLRGSEICIQTRILTICDIFDALTAADRPYKKSMPTEAALELMQLECRAGHLDAALFSAFVESGSWAAQEAR
jgi:3',5'-cyclic-nucleotide phosphodiesterase